MSEIAVVLAVVLGSAPLVANANPAGGGAKTPKSVKSCQVRPVSAYVLGDSLGFWLKNVGLDVTLRALLRGPQKISFDGGRSITTPDAYSAIGADERRCRCGIYFTRQSYHYHVGHPSDREQFPDSQVALMRKLKAPAPHGVCFWADIGATMSTQAQQWSERK